MAELPGYAKISHTLEEFKKFKELMTAIMDEKTRASQRLQSYRIFEYVGPGWLAKFMFGKQCVVDRKRLKEDYPLLMAWFSVHRQYHEKAEDCVVELTPSDRFERARAIYFLMQVGDTILLTPEQALIFFQVTTGNENSYCK